VRIAAICCTYRRVRELSTAIECFLRQDYIDREMVVLDDAGQFAADALNGLPGVKLVSSPIRFRTLGEKRNASAALVSPDVEAYCVWDDDDIYLPWHMSASAAALKDADYTIPTAIFVEKGGRLQRKCARPNSERIRSRIKAVRIRIRRRPVSRIPENFGEAWRDGAGEVVRRVAA